MGIETVQEGAQQLVRKSFTQAHVGEGRPRVTRFVVKMSGVIVLKAEL